MSVPAVDWECWPNSPSHGLPSRCKCQMPYARWVWQYEADQTPFCKGCGATETVQQRYEFVPDALWCDYCWDMHLLRTGPRGLQH